MRVLLAFAVLATASLLLFLWWPDAGEPAQGGTTDKERTPAAATPAVPAATENTASGPAAAPGRQVLPEAFDGPTGNVRVVLFGSNAPVAGATVHYQPPDFDWQKLTPERTRELQALGKDTEQLLRSIGRESLTDSEGRCRVPLGKHGTQVVARSGELYGQAYVHGKQQDVVLVLRNDRTLRILAVDERGRPAVDIQLLVERTASGKDASRWLWGPTDGRGRYEQVHVQTLVQNDASGLAQVSALPAGGAGPSVAFDLTAPPPEVVVHLGPTGSVLVRVLDGTGQPLDPAFLGSPQVRIAGFDKRPETSEQQSDGFNRQHCGATIDPHGIARFPYVALGRYLIVRRDHSSTKGFDGPSVAQPQVEVTLQDSADGALFIGTLLDASGAPFANRKFSISARMRGGMSSREERTDDRGRLRCYLDTHVIADHVALTLGTPQLERDNPLSVELPPRKVQAGINDLGEVRLLPQVVLLAGRLVCDAGVDVQQVYMNVERRQDQRWTQEWQLRPEWKADGTFMVRGGMRTGEPLRLVVQEGPYVPVQSIECKVGDTGIEIPLRVAGSVSAVFLVEERTPVERMHFRLLRTQPPEKQDATQTRLMDQIRFAGQTQGQDGKLNRQWTGLITGTYELVVTCPGSSEPVVRIEAIAVTSGPCSDPRLASIDLRSRVTTFEVRATDADGQPVASIEASVVTRSEGDHWYGYNLGTGVVTLAASSTLDLYVVAPGHRLAAVSAVRESRTVPLERAETSTLQIELPAPLPEGVDFHLRLQPKLEFSRRASISLDTGRGMMLEDFFVQDVLLGADGVAKVAVRCPGEHTIEATVATGNRGGTYIRDFTPKTVVLPAGPGTTVKVGAKGLEEALQRMRR
jgi:hypothetical protein